MSTLVKLNSVGSASLVKVNGIAVASIVKIIGQTYSGARDANSILGALCAQFDDGVHLGESSLFNEIR